MTVYDMRDKNAVNPWNYLLTRGAGGLLDNFISGMFQRDAEARQVDRSKRLYGAVEDEMSRSQGAGLPMPAAPLPEYGEDVRALAGSATGGRGLYDAYVTPEEGGGWSGLWNGSAAGRRGVPGREAFLRGLARHGATPQEARTLSDLYMNQFETADKLGYGDAVAGRVGGLDYDVRSNPAGAMRSGMVAQAYDLRPEELMAYAYPNYEQGNFSAGDREVLYSHDPRTGTFSSREYGYGVNPTKRYQSDAETEQANISAGAQRYVADRNYDGRWVPSFKEIYGPNGEVQVLNTRSGAVTDTGARSYPRGGGGQSGAKALTPQQRLSLGQAAVGATRDMEPEEKWNYIVRMSQGDSEAIDAMARSVFAGGRIPMAAAEFFKTGSLRQAGAAPDVSQPVLPEPQLQTPQQGASGQPADGSSVMRSSVVAEARARFPDRTRGLSDEQVWALLMQYR
ncbi:MAG: hypothetical protein Q4D58_00710 [Synergistaceae bacterium]|nr:hypothetical protein [Synergistaceae bacterium]